MLHFNLYQKNFNQSSTRVLEETEFRYVSSNFNRSKYLIYYMHFFLKIFYLLILERERKREREREILFQLFMHSLVASCMCPDWRLNTQSWSIRDDAHPTEQPGQGLYAFRYIQNQLLLATLANK